jgi:hypothetical protein
LNRIKINWDFEKALLDVERRLQAEARLKILYHLQKSINAVPGYGTVKLELVQFRNKPDRVLIQLGSARSRIVHIDDLSEINMIRVIATLIPGRS